MKVISILIFPIFLVLLFSCREKPADHSDAQKAGETKKEIVVPVEFIPPSDSVITPAQFTNWKSCNQLLDSLTFRYADSFKVEDPVAIIRFQEDFINAQDRICVRAGLSGGYREYKWVLQHMGIEKNRPLLQSANAQSF